MRFTNEPHPYTAPVPPSSHQSMMNTPAKTGPATPVNTPFITPDTTPARAHDQRKHNDTPGGLPPVPTRDFYLDTFFNPVWTSGPNVFSFAPDGTVVRPNMYAAEPYPCYHADRMRRLEAEASVAASTSYSQGFVSRDPKPWKNVAITEQDDAEFEAFQARVRAGLVGEWRPARPYYGHVPSSMPDERELVYTWPPKPDGR